MQKRIRDREKEVELDERDRKREKEELEEIRQRLLAEGHPDPDAELQRVGHSCCLQHILHTSSVEMRRLTCTRKAALLEWVQSSLST